MKKRGYLILEDGSRYEGTPFGFEKSVSGEVVFTTSMFGYPESLTDPSYHGQILVFSYPLIGNYGVPEKKLYADSCLENFESENIWVSGVIVSQEISTPSHYSHNKTFAEWLQQERIPGLSGIDTRALIIKLREYGVMKGKIHFDKGEKYHESFEGEEFVDINATNLVSEVSIKKPMLYQSKKGRFKKPILLIDCGVKHGIIRQLLERALSVYRVPWDFDIKDPSQYSGVVISNGPGDPIIVDKTIASIRSLLRENLPIFGICLGNQLVALAAGAKTYKLKYGHRSCNQPCRDNLTGKCIITTQNHGYAVDTRSLSNEWREWFINLNDGTNEGLRHKTKPIVTVQFHPEACPGPEDAQILFDEFALLVEKYEKKS